MHAHACICILTFYVGSNWTGRLEPEHHEHESDKQSINKNKNWTSGRRNSSPERAIYPQGGRKKVERKFAIFRSAVTCAWWLVIEEAGGGGWFLSKHDVVAGF